MSKPVLPSSAISESMRPTRLANLKPCPENPVARTRFAQSGCVSMRKSSSGVSVVEADLREKCLAGSIGYAFTQKRTDMLNVVWIGRTIARIGGYRLPPCRAAQPSRLHGQTREIHIKPHSTLHRGKSGIFPAETGSHLLGDNTQPVAVLRSTGDSLH